MKSIKNIFIIILLPTIFFACEGDNPGPSETLPTLTIVDGSWVEGNENTSFDIQVRLSEASTKEVSVSYSSVDGVAKAGEDFVKLETEILTFAPGETSKDLAIDIIADEIREEDETFTITLTYPFNAQITRSEATVTIFNDDVLVDLSSLEIPTDGYISASSYPGLTLTWQDEFTGTEISNDWTFEIGDGCSNGICGWGNNELEYYRKENAFIADDNYLVIQAYKENFGGKNYTSSRMITKGAKKFQYGRIDIRAAMPTGQGLWPALWMLGNNIDQVGWPACGEIDIMEVVGNDPDRCHGTVHWDNNGQYASYGQNTLSSKSLKDEFHVYSIVWTQNSIKWLLDDVEYNVIDLSPAALSEFKQEFFFILNVAVGGNWPGSPNNSTVFPQRMLVDYIRVFQ